MCLTVENSDRGGLMFEVGVRVRIWVLLLEGDVAVELGQVLAKRAELIVKVLRQLLAPDLMRAAVNDQSSQVFPSLFLI